MTNRFNRWAGAGLALVLALTTTACDDFLTVGNPTVVEAAAVDPVEDAPTFAVSAQQNLATSLGWLAMYSGWFTGETRVTETFPTRNEFGRRSLSDTNASLNAEVWGPLSVARASADNLVHMLTGTPGEQSVHMARASMVAGFAVQFMAEHFCVGTISGPGNEPGPALNEQQMLAAAIERFTRAIDVGRAVNTATSNAIANAALVGRARAHLQAGNTAQALADAQAVPAGFVFNLNYIDDVGSRTRLSNRMWQFTVDRGSIGVAPAFRVNDPRVPSLAPGTHPYNAFESSVQSEFWVQQKYPNYAAPIRLASKLEADYIAAEAQGTAAMLTLIQARRAANDQPAYTGPTDAQSVLRELMRQRSLEFFLEARRMGDFRRNPGAVADMPDPNQPYWAPGYGPMGDDTCWPLPRAETDNNPHFQ
jgi:starch-binding outer membrane protein, SusD/RagB family